MSYFAEKLNVKAQNAAKQKVTRGARRYKFDEGEQEVVRFLNNQDKRIMTTAIFDISETGIAFITHMKYAPHIGEIIKMDFAPLGSVRMACLGRVIRIETQLKNHSWAKFPDMVKVGVMYHEMPKVYRKALVAALESAFDKRGGYSEERVINVTPRAQRPSWFVENIWSILFTCLLLSGVAYGVYRFSQVDPDQAFHDDGQNWATGFFDRTLKK